ncbi:MAG: thioredoxin domain-containing protein [Dehalococcoidia bacterium]|nr:thioredoxin domain-containing protein [Dehalococcoidia bacterium]
MSGRVFLAANAAAVIMAAVLIILGRIGQPADAFIVSPPDAELPPATPAHLRTSMGSPDAPISILVYSDFQCAVCQQFALTTSKQIEASYVETGTAYLTFKHFVIYDEESILAAMAAEAAADQGMFWPYHDLVMQLRASSKKEDLTVARLQDLARQAGLDIAAFNAAFLSGNHRDEILREKEESLALGIRGTPTFFVNGRKAEGNVPFASFQSLIEELLAAEE